jgi:hypothetical protein
MNNNTTKIIKLSNGEDIVCTCVESKNTKDSKVLHISQPLRMEIRNKVTTKGAVEALTLSRWLKPFSQADDFHLAKSNIVTITDASYALNNYYNFMLNVHNESTYEDDKMSDDDIMKLQAKFDDSISDEEAAAANEEVRELFNKYVKNLNDNIKPKTTKPIVGKVVNVEVKESGKAFREKKTKMLSEEELDMMYTSKTIH